MRELLGSCERNPLTATLCGYKGGNFACRKLVHGNTKIIPRQTKLKIPPSRKIAVEKVLANQIGNQLYVPTTSNYTAIDAWIPGIGAFQMTVGKKHDITGGAIDDLVMLGKGASKLYWLLPPLYYDTCTKKTPQDIDQYAVQIPYPTLEN